MARVEEAAHPPTPAAHVSLGEIFLTFLVIGGISFGGGVVAYLRNSLVTSKHWLDKEEFLAALEISQAMPGLNATNMSVIVGDRLRGPVGAIVAFLGMTLPGSVILFLLGVFYAANQGDPLVRSVLAGIGAAAVGLLAAVTLQIGGKQLEHLLDLTIVAITVLLVSVFHVPLLVVLVTVGPVAIYLYRPRSPRPSAARPLAADSTGLDKKPAD
jgi:chromate transporter